MPRLSAAQGEGEEAKKQWTTSFSYLQQLLESCLIKFSWGRTEKERAKENVALQAEARGGGRLLGRGEEEKAACAVAALVPRL